MILGILFALVLTWLCRDIFEMYGMVLGMVIAGPGILFAFFAGIIIWLAGKHIKKNYKGEKRCSKA